jgi:hypothetical protein
VFKLKNEEVMENKDLQSVLDSAVKDQRAKDFERTSQLTLGEMIEKCESILAGFKEGEAVPRVGFDFEGLIPTELDSWRGTYSELALGFRAEENGVELEDFLKMLKDAVGKTYEGYKGGEYTMWEDTPVWVANYGIPGYMGVKDIVCDNYSVTIVTAKYSYW